MKWRISSASLLVIASCSTPKYTYFFDQPAGSAKEIQAVAVVVPDSLVAPVRLDLEVSTSPTLASSGVASRSAIQRKQVKGSEVRLQPEQPATSKATAKMDVDLKRSAIFTVSGIVALVIGGQVFWVLGAVSLLIGLIFGIKWLLRQ